MLTSSSADQPSAVGSQAMVGLQVTVVFDCCCCVVQMTQAWLRGAERWLLLSPVQSLLEAQQGLKKYLAMLRCHCWDPLLAVALRLQLVDS